MNQSEYSESNGVQPDILLTMAEIFFSKENGQSLKATSYQYTLS
jgi:hypothetical protein